MGLYRYWIYYYLKYRMPPKQELEDLGLTPGTT